VTKRVVAVALAVGVLVACGGGGRSSTVAGGDGAEVDVVAVAAVARKLRGQPQRADEILAEAGWDRARFEAALFTIAEDPKASVRYGKLLQQQP
jgi:hypothetical protein